MKREELTKTFMMISNWKETFGFYVYIKYKFKYQQEYNTARHRKKITTNNTFSETFLQDNAYTAVDLCAAINIRFQANFRLNKIPLEFDISCGRCLANRIIQFGRCLSLKNNIIFQSFKIGNCLIHVIISSFKWSILTNILAAQVKMCTQDGDFGRLKNIKSQWSLSAEIFFVIPLLTSGDWSSLNPYQVSLCTHVIWYTHF